MEALKRKRTQFRRAFTSYADTFEKAISNKERALADRKFIALTECADELFRCEAEIRDLWIEESDFNEEAYQEDQDRMLTYRDRWAEMRNLYKDFSRMIKDNDNDDIKVLANRMNKRKRPAVYIVRSNPQLCYRQWLYKLVTVMERWFMSAR
ncbi:hypothetical protein ACJJTC_011532 [Scirpophaga incertulas]